MKKLTEAHIEQIKNMSVDGKTYAEIREFFQDTYKIKLWDSEIASIKRGNSQKVLKTRAKRKLHKMSKTVLPVSDCSLKPICRYVAICNIELCKFRG